MKLINYSIILILLSACAEDVAPPEVPCTTTQSVQNGEYTMETEEAFGDCGSLGTMDVMVEDGKVLLIDGLGCTLDYSEWDQDVCTTNSAWDCDDGTWIMRLEWSVSSDPAIPENLQGTLNAVMDKWNGIYTCESEYTFTAVPATEQIQ